MARTSSLVERLNDVRGGPFVFAGRDGVELEASRAELRERAGRASAALLAAGLGPGHHVAMVGTTGVELVSAVIGCWISGIAVSVLPTPLRLRSPSSLADDVRARMDVVEPDAVIVPDALLDAGDWKARPTFGLDALQREGGRASEAGSLGLTDGTTAVVQFTSGSTNDPRGVIVKHGQVAGNVRAYGEAGRLTDDEVLVSWLPIYHDMGLIGYLAGPLVLGAQKTVLIDVGDYARDPALWPRSITRHRATLTSAPDAAYASAARRPAAGEVFDLSSMRLAFDGAEPIDPRTFELLERSEVWGTMSPRAAFPCYGLAEATLSVTYPEPGAGPRIIDAPEELRREAGTPARLVSVGRAIPGVGLRIADPRPGELLGEIEIGGEFVTEGYHRRPDLASALFTPDGWLRTGDLGLFTDDGELIVVGRTKEVIIVGGRNYVPEEFERVASGVPGVRPGQVIAFGTSRDSGREGVVVACEVRDMDAAGDVAKQVSAAVWDRCGILIADVVCLEAGQLPKTSSGKRQRVLCRAQYLEGQLS